MIGACFVTSWFLGMVVSTPMYHPFPRLSLMLLTAVWLAAAAGAAWWVEAGINVSRRGEPKSETRRTRSRKRTMSALVIVALGITLGGAGGLYPPAIWQDRTSLRDAAWQLGDTMLRDAAGDYQKPEVPLTVNENGIISPTPDSVGSDADGNPLLPLSTIEQLESLVAPRFDTSIPLAAPGEATCAVYCFGEPAVLWHLSSAGLNVGPVQDLNFGPAKLERDLLPGIPLPTYLVLGPNALRTPGLLNDWAIAQRRFEHVANFYFAPSDVVIYNLFSPEWVAQHVEVNVQKLELYRLRVN